MGGTFNLASNDTISVTCTTITVGATATLPLAAGTVTARVTLAPTGAALNTTTTPASVLTGATTGQIPRYQSSLTAAVTVVNIVPAQTTFLIPYVTTAAGFDTGIALANTSDDKIAFSSGNAVPVNGTISFYFFPTAATGTPFSYTTSATSPGQGFPVPNTNGNINAGKSYIVLLSQLLQAAGAPPVFSGYIFAVANFTNGHGSAFPTNFSGFTSNTPVLVMPNPPQVPRPIGSVESLGQ